MASDTVDVQISCHVMQPICHIILSTTWQQPQCVHSLFPQEYTIQVATCIVDVQISCHPVQLVTETTVTTDLLHFTIPTVWQLSQLVRKN